jgi:alpha-N-arabinofuranosidase
MILTEGDRMVLTPTYHVFRMYIPFQDATFLPVSLEASPDYALGEYSVPAVSATAARGADGKLYASLANLDPDEASEVTLEIEGAAARVVAAEILTAPRMDSHNTFDAPEQVRPRAFDGASVRGGVLRVEMPAKSIVMITLE